MRSHPIVSLTLATLALGGCGAGPQTKAPAPETHAEVASGGTVPTEAPATPAPVPTSTATPSDVEARGSAREQNPDAPREFTVQKSDAAKDAPRPQSKIKPTHSEAALKFTVVDKDKGPIRGIVISLTAPGGSKFYTEETNAEGYTELLVPVGQKYDVVYLSLGRKEITTSVPVSDEPNQNIRLTLRYKRLDPPPRPKPAPTAPAAPAEEPRFVLDGVTFDSGKATIRPESFPRLDGVVEYMTYKKSVRIQISGHTDNVGNPKINKALSQKRAQACRDYLISKGIDGSRVEAIGYGDEWPIASNDTEEGRQANRRIEAVEM